MLRAVVVAGVFAIGVQAIAAEDPISARRALMKANGQAGSSGAAMLRGDAPFDVAKAKAIFVTFQNAAAKAPALFPDDSKQGGETAALPKIWENKADFEARFAKLGADSKAAEASVADPASFKAAFSEVGKSCGGCHETYRLKK